MHMRRKYRMQKIISVAVLAVLCLLAFSGCGRQKAISTESALDSMAAETADASAAEETEAALDSEAAETLDAPDAAAEKTAESTGNAVTAEPKPLAEPKALAEYLVHEETLCDEESGTALVNICWYQPQLVGNVFPAQEKINAALAGEMEQTLAQIEQKEVDEEELYLGDYLYAMAKADLACRKEDAESFDGELHFEPYDYGRSYELARADGEAVSFISITDTYLGGAHGSQIVAGENYDAQSGERLCLSDIWTDEELFRQTCEKEIIALAEKMTETEGEIFFGNYKENVPDLIADDLWYFSENGLVFISQEYMLQCYAAGTITFEIPYEKLRECLK